MKRILLLLSLFVAASVNAQKLKKEDRQLLADLQHHVQYLAHDSLEGRRTGTAGEQKAMAYISQQFKTIGLAPKGSNGYYQPFEINEGKQISPSSHLVVDGHDLVLYKEYVPLVYSASQSLEALPSRAIQEADMPWFWDVKDVLEENRNNPHFDIHTAIKNKAKEVQGKRASALLVFNSSNIDDDIQFNGTNRSEAVGIPVVYLTKEAMKKYFSDEGATLDMKLKVVLEDKKRTGNNVIGYLDNGAATTVILGAHFDHLGFGEDGNSLLRTAGNQVHNGADDNASGTAALIELARMLKNSRLKNNNYLFIAFSGEEQGLFGSKYFTENSTIDLSKVNYMINMDMLGRLNEANKTLTVGGYGTSPAWPAAFAQSGKTKLYTGPLQFRFDSSGVGPSDHTSFYRKDIPVLFYFTGLHSDYHRPTDDADKVNYTGQLHVVKHIYSLIEAIDKGGQKVAFTKTREPQMTTSAQFSVTLGIMPDYTFSGSGVKVDGVSEGKVAQKAGIKAGDVITQLGEHSVTSLESYMQALSKFKKGDKTTVQYNRSHEKLSAAIEF